MLTSPRLCPAYKSCAAPSASHSVTEMASASLKLQVEGAVHRPLPRSSVPSSGFLGRKRLLAETDPEERSAKRQRVCGNELPESVAVVPRLSKASQTSSVAIPRLPTASRSFPVPWGVRRPSSSSSTQTVSSPITSSVDDLCDVPDDENGVLEDEVFASDNECMQEILKALHYLSERESLGDETQVDEGLLPDLPEEGKASDVEGAFVCSVSDGRRDVATNTSNVSLRSPPLPPPRRRSWRKASRSWRSRKNTCTSATQTD